MQAIIFLAPLTFNLALEEDPSVNRIEDSIIIWKAICSNRLLERTTIILFLNKMDVLSAALESGLQVKDYVTSYGDLPNDMPSVAKCMSFLAWMKPVSQLLLSQTSGTNSRRITYVCPSVIETFSHSIFPEKAIPQASTVFLARNISHCTSVELAVSSANVPCLMTGYQRHKRNTFRRSGRHHSLPTIRLKCDLDLIVWFVGFFHHWAQSSGCSASPFRKFIHRLSLF